MVGQQVIVKGEDFMGENCRHKLGCGLVYVRLGRIGPYSVLQNPTKSLQTKPILHLIKLILKSSIFINKFFYIRQIAYVFLNNFHSPEF